MSTPPAPPAEALTAVHPVGKEMPQFERTRSGYHVDQVNDYIHGLLDHAHTLEHELARFTREGASKALHIAESPQGQRMIDELMRLALDEITGQKAAAQHDIEQMLQNASRQAAQVLAGADSEATKLVAAAREQADTVLNGARADAKRMLDTAAAKAAAVSDGAERRMTAMIGHHAETVRRLNQIHQVTGDLLQADSDRGALQDEVTRASAAVAAHAPAQLTAGAQAGEPPDGSGAEAG